jgi:hypothetical protein
LIAGLAHVGVEVSDVDEAIEELSAFGWTTIAARQHVSVLVRPPDEYPASTTDLELALLRGECLVPLELTRHQCSRQPLARGAALVVEAASATFHLGGPVEGEALRPTAPSPIVLVVPAADVASAADFWSGTLRAPSTAKGPGCSTHRLRSALRGPGCDLVLQQSPCVPEEVPLDRIGSVYPAMLSTDLSQDVENAARAGATVVVRSAAVVLGRERARIALLRAPGAGLVELVEPGL